MNLRPKPPERLRPEKVIETRTYVQEEWLSGEKQFSPPVMFIRGSRKKILGQPTLVVTLRAVVILFKKESRQ